MRRLVSAFVRLCLALGRFLGLTAFAMFTLVLVVFAAGGLIGLDVLPYFARQIAAIFGPPLRSLGAYVGFFREEYVSAAILVCIGGLFAVVGTAIAAQNERAAAAKIVVSNRRARLTGIVLGVHAGMWIVGTLGYELAGAADTPTLPLVWTAFNAVVVVVAAGHSRRRTWAHVAAFVISVAWIAVAGMFAASAAPSVAEMVASKPETVRPADWTAIGGLIYGLAAVCIHLAVVAAAARGLLIAYHRRTRPQTPSATGARPSLFERLATEPIGIPKPAARAITFGRAVGWAFRGAVAVIAFAMMWNVVQEAWWQEELGPVATRTVDTRHPGASAERLRHLVGRFPDQSRLYYLLAGMYLADSHELAAATVMAAYKEVSDANAARALTERFSFRYVHTQRAVRRTIEEIDRRLAATRQTIYTLFQSLPAGSVTLASRYTAADLLQRPARADANAAVLNLDVFSETGVACLRPSACASAFLGASASTAVRTGRLNIRYPRGGAHCCAVSLQDPDLLLLALPSSAEAVPPRLLPELLSVASRMLFKQMFMRDFIAFADGEE